MHRSGLSGGGGRRGWPRVWWAGQATVPAARLDAEHGLWNSRWALRTGGTCGAHVVAPPSLLVQGGPVGVGRITGTPQSLSAPKRTVRAGIGVGRRSAGSSAAGAASVAGSSSSSSMTCAVRRCWRR